MKRKQLPPPRRKITAPIPDRLPVEELLVGPIRAFKPSQLTQFHRQLERTPTSYWIILYSGKGYVDLDLNTTKESTTSTIRHFTHCYPKAKVIYLKPPPDTPKPKPNGQGTKRHFDKKKYEKAVKGRRY